MSGIAAVLFAAFGLIWLFFCALADIKTRRIPNRLILTGVLLWLGGACLSCLFSDTTVFDAFIPGLGAGLITGAVFLIPALAAPGRFGMGDVKLLAVLAAMYGFWDTLRLALIAFIAMLLFALVTKPDGAGGRNTALPLAPFFFAAALFTEMIHFL